MINLQETDKSGELFLELPIPGATSGHLHKLSIKNYGKSLFYPTNFLLYFTYLIHFTLLNLEK